MTEEQRRRLVARVLAGYLTVRPRGLALRLHDPTPEARLRAEEAYEEAYAEATSGGAYTAAEAVSLAEADGLWCGERQARLDQAQEDLDDLKVSLYRDFFDPESREKTRGRIAACREVIRSLSDARESYQGLSAEAIAAARKARVSCGLSLRTPRGEPALGPDPGLWDAALVDEAVSLAAEARPSEAALRELARTAPWQSYWSVGGPNPFGVPAALLGDDRLALLSFSQMYDRVRDSADRPPREVVEDDDALDGWLVVQRRNDPGEKERVKKMLFGNEKIASAQEVFRVVRSAEEAARVESMNDPLAAAEKRARERQIAEGGAVEHHHLGDVRRDIARRAEEARRG